MEGGGRRIGRRSDWFVLRIFKHALDMWTAIKNFFVDCHICLFAVHISHIFPEIFNAHRIGLYADIDLWSDNNFMYY